MADSQEVNPNFVHASNREVRPFKNGQPPMSLAEALTRLGVFDSLTAKRTEKGIIKLLRQMSRTGSRVYIKDGKSIAMMIEVGEYEYAGFPRPKLRARFDKKLQQAVRDSLTETILARKAQ